MGNVAKINLCILLALVPQAVYSTPVINQAESHYSIAGGSADELHAQMNNVGPAVEGHRYNATTEYYVKWEMRYLQNDEGCKIVNSSVMLNITQILPEWQNYTTAAPNLQHDWDIYSIKLKEHEAGHSNHGVQAANEVETMIAAMPVMANCALLESTVKAKTDEIVSKYKSMDVEYDRVTNHGATQSYH